MALQPTGGFAAISQKPPAGPLARKQLVRNPDGSVSLQYIDNNTGQKLPSLDGYNLVEASNYLQLEDLGLDPLQQTKETTAEVVKKKPIAEQREGGDSDSFSDPSGQGFARGGPTNNFGYIDKPGWMGFASAIPGPVGLAGKAANIGINAMNTSAVNEARSMMGLPKQSFMENVKSTVKDQHGQIGDVKIQTPQGIAQYPVGFEAQDKHGRTNMTPQEASLRARANQSDLSLASKPEVKSSVSDFKAEYPNERQGLLSKVEGFIDNLFGRDSESSYASGFPDAPAAPSSRDAGSRPTASSPAGGAQAAGGFNDGSRGDSQADRAAASGGAGLY